MSTQLSDCASRKAGGRSGGLELRSPASADATDIDYCADVRGTLERVLVARHRLSAADAADAASEAMLRLLPRLHSTRAAYPHSHVYALAVAFSAAEDHRRRERAQRGQGARNTVGSDGVRTAGREVVPFDPAIHATSHADDPADDAILIDLLQWLLARTDASTRLLLWRVFAEGQTVTSAATALGLSRTKATRQLSTGLSEARAQLAA